MLTVERELTAAIYILYCLDCIHWLKPGEMALTRRWDGRWKTHSFKEDSYTLLGRMPVFVNPVDLRPSFVSGSISELGPIEQSIPEFALRCAHDAKILFFLSLLGAVNLLVFLPSLLITGYVGAWWRVPTYLALFIQICLAFEIYEQGAAWRVARRSDFWQQFISMALNPLAALRSGDQLLNGLFASGIYKKVTKDASRKGR